MWTLFWIVVVVLVLLAILANLRDLIRYFRIRNM